MANDPGAESALQNISAEYRSAGSRQKRGTAPRRPYCWFRPLPQVPRCPRGAHRVPKPCYAPGRIVKGAPVAKAATFASAVTTLPGLHALKVHDEPPDGLGGVFYHAMDRLYTPIGASAVVPDVR
jgi:hypothetical protein